MAPYEIISPSFTCTLKSFTYTESIFPTVADTSFTALRTASSKLELDEAITSITFTIAIMELFKWFQSVYEDKQIDLQFVFTDAASPWFRSSRRLLWHLSMRNRNKFVSLLAGQFLLKLLQRFILGFGEHKQGKEQICRHGHRKKTEYIGGALSDTAD